MKVLIIITKSNYGGAQRYVYDIASNLPKKVEVVVAHGGSGIIKDKLKSIGIRTITLPHLERDISILKEWQAFKDIYRVIQEEKPDVLHLNSSKAAFLGSLAGRILQTPRIIFTSHGWAFNENRNIFTKMVFKMLHGLTIVLSHKTIAVSNAVACSYPLLKSKFAVINPAITVPHYKSRKDARQYLGRNTTKTGEQEIWLVTIAELHPTKNISLAIEALSPILKKNHNIKYFVIGSGQEEEMLKNKVKALKLEQQIVFPGFITDAAVFLKAFDVFILTSISEAYGYVLLEAGHAALPIIVSRVGGVTDIVEESTGTFFKSGNVNELQKAVDEFLRHPAPYKEKGQRLQQKCRSVSVPKMIDETMQLYQA